MARGAPDAFERQLMDKIRQSNGSIRDLLMTNRTWSVSEIVLRCAIEFNDTSAVQLLIPRRKFPDTKLFPLLDVATTAIRAVFLPQFRTAKHLREIIEAKSWAFAADIIRAGVPVSTAMLEAGRGNDMPATFAQELVAQRFIAPVQLMAHLTVQESFTALLPLCAALWSKLCEMLIASPLLSQQLQWFLQADVQTPDMIAQCLRYRNVQALRMVLATATHQTPLSPVALSDGTMNAAYLSACAMLCDDYSAELCECVQVICTRDAAACNMNAPLTIRMYRFTVLEYAILQAPVHVVSDIVQLFVTLGASLHGSAVPGRQLHMMAPSDPLRTRFPFAADGDADANKDCCVLDVGQPVTTMTSPSGEVGDPGDAQIHYAAARYFLLSNGTLWSRDTPALRALFGARVFVHNAQYTCSGDTPGVSIEVHHSPMFYQAVLSGARLFGLAFDVQRVLLTVVHPLDIYTYNVDEYADFDGGAVQHKRSHRFVVPYLSRCLSSAWLALSELSPSSSALDSVVWLLAPDTPDNDLKWRFKERVRLATLSPDGCFVYLIREVFSRTSVVVHALERYAVGAKPQCVGRWERCIFEPVRTLQVLHNVVYVLTDTRIHVLLWDLSVCLQTFDCSTAHVDGFDDNGEFVFCMTGLHCSVVNFAAQLRVEVPTMWSMDMHWCCPLAVRNTVRGVLLCEQRLRVCDKQQLLPLEVWLHVFALMRF